MKRLIAPIILSVAFMFSMAHSKDIAIEPSGIYKTIDVRLMNDTIKTLQQSKPKSKSRIEVVKKITDSPENYAPPVFYLLSSAFLQEDKKDDAMFWFYAAQLRGRVDANICAENPARNIMDVLNEKFGPEINQYAFKDIPKLTNTVEKVLAWEEKTEYKYDRRWINLEGMNVFTGDTNSPLSAPKEQWESIRKKTRDDYRSSFYEALKMVDEKALTPH